VVDHRGSALRVPMTRAAIAQPCNAELEPAMEQRQSIEL
jgi:hypothetical protein